MLMFEALCLQMNYLCCKISHYQPDEGAKQRFSKFFGGWGGLPAGPSDLWIYDEGPPAPPPPCGGFNSDWANGCPLARDSPGPLEH